METTEKATEVLNDLIEINNDRIAGFAHAGKDLSENDMDLLALFQQLREEGRENVHQLSTLISNIGGEAEEADTSSTGAIHRAWLDVKATFTGHDRKSVLAECERGEDAIKKAYKDALQPENGLSAEITEIVLRQQQGINVSHDKIKALRDSAE